MNTTIENNIYDMNTTADEVRQTYELSIVELQQISGGTSQSELFITVKQSTWPPQVINPKIEIQQ